MTDIVVLGSVNIDLVVRTEYMPQPGETVHGYQFQTIPGGKGANQAAAAARLGARVEMVGRVGRDPFGPVLLDNLRAQGVGTSHIAIDSEEASGTAIIIVDAQGENAIVVALGANGRVATADVDAAIDLIAAAHTLILQFEIPLPVVRYAIKKAQARGTSVILNPAPACAVEPSFLAGVDVLVANAFEAHTLTGIKVTDLAAAQRAAETLHEFGVPIAIVTLGAQGAFLSTAHHAAHIPARQVKAVDTTAAGDAFVGALAVARLRGLDWLEAVRYATCAGTLATTVFGAQTSLPTADRLQAFYEGGNP